MVVGGSSSRWVCAPVTAVAVGRVGYHAHREEEPPPVDHSHGRRRQAAAASLEASYGTRWHRVDAKSAVLARRATLRLLQCAVDRLCYYILPLTVELPVPPAGSRFAFRSLDFPANLHNFGRLRALANTGAAANVADG